MSSRRSAWALRVPGAPASVAMWIDHERDDGVLYLNADLFTTAQEREISRVLRAGDFTAWDLLKALVPAQGD